MSDDPAPGFRILGLRNGVLTGLSGAQPADGLDVRLGGRVVARTRPTADGNGWEASLPGEVLTEGAAVLTVHRAGEVDPLDAYPLIVGPLDRADALHELALLRAELDLLKAAFRRDRRKRTSGE